MNLVLKRRVLVILLSLIVLVSLVFLGNKFFLSGRRDYNVLLITIDSLKPDHLSCYGYQKNTSPNLDKIAKEGVLFSNAYSTASWTSPGLISLLTSLYPSVHGVQERDHSISPGIATFPKVLKNNGYYAPGFGFLLTLPNYAHLGFDTLDEALLDHDDSMLVPWLKANKDRKFFLWYHYTIPHLPYNPPEPYASKFYPGHGKDGEASPWLNEIRREPAIRKEAVMQKGGFRFSEKEREEVIALYDGEVAYMDSILGKFIDEVKSLGLWDKTMLIITADHGEELLEHGFIGHASTSLESSLYDELLRIPLIMRFPGDQYRGKRVALKVGLIDVLPTVLDYLGIERPQSLQGNSLIPFIQDTSLRPERPIFAESSTAGYQLPEGQEPVWEKTIICEGWKLISREEEDSLSYKLYNLRSDPEETNDLIDEERETALRLQLRLGEWILSNEILGSRLTVENGKEESPIIPTSKIPTILRPSERETLDFRLNNARAVLEWAGEPGGRYIIEYSVGTGDRHLSGTFEVVSNVKEFGPIYKETWELLSNYNPFRFRVRYYSGSEWSEWREFSF